MVPRPIDQPAQQAWPYHPWVAPATDTYPCPISIHWIAGNLLFVESRLEKPYDYDPLIFSSHSETLTLSIMFDIPPRIRFVLAVAAVGGFLFIAMGSLAAGASQQIHLDKLVHGTGYAMLGLLVILALPPIWYLPALVGITLAGVGLEIAQGMVLKGRDADWMDALVNAKGLALGACFGFLVRLTWNYLRKELAEAADRKRMCFFKKGDVVFREGDVSDCLYVIKNGSVRVSAKSEDGGDGEKEICVLAPGEVLGEMGVVEKLPRSATATAVENLALYRMEAERIEVGEEGREHPALHVARTLARRLREANQRF